MCEIINVLITIVWIILGVVVLIFGYSFVMATKGDLGITNMNKEE